MAVQVDVRESTPDHAMGVWKGVVLYNWRDRTTVEGLRAVERLASDAGKDGVGLLFGVVESGCAPPEGAVKEGLAGMLRSLNGRIVGSALTFDGKGFQAAMIRLVAMGLGMLARTEYPHRAFGDLREAAEFLNKQISAKGLTPYPTAELVEALTALRQAPLK